MLSRLAQPHAGAKQPRGPDEVWDVGLRVPTLTGGPGARNFRPPRS